MLNYAVLGVKLVDHIEDVPRHEFVACFIHQVSSFEMLDALDVIELRWKRILQEIDNIQIPIKSVLSNGHNARHQFVFLEVGVVFRGQFLFEVPVDAAIVIRFVFDEFLDENFVVKEFFGVVCVFVACGGGLA